MYSSNNFLEGITITSTTKAFRILDKNGLVKYIVNVCSYQKSSVTSNTIQLILNNYTNPIILDFATSTDALTAFSLLVSRINELKVNCVTASGGGGEDEYDGPKIFKINTGGTYVWTSSADPFAIPPGVITSGHTIDLYYNGQKLIRDKDFTVSSNSIIISSTTLVGPYDANYNCGYAVCISATDFLELVIY